MSDTAISDAPIIVWFRRDLRLSDHPALSAAVANGSAVVPCFIFDEAAAGAWRAGGASRWWLHGSLDALGRAIAEKGGHLILRRGDTAKELIALAAKTGAKAVYASRAFEPWASRQEHDVRNALSEEGIEFKRFGGTLLHDPDQLKTQADTPFKVYTPFWRALSQRVTVGRVRAAPAKLVMPAKAPKSVPLASWGLLPAKPDWAAGFRDAWVPGEEGAQDRLTEFLDEALAGYKDMRNRPDRIGTSRLSPHLAFGEISPRQCWSAAEAASAHQGRSSDEGRETFLKELAWREFSAHLLHHFPTLPDEPFREEFAAFPWKRDAAGLKAWQKGLTGYPIVDAGMRELWATGWMHNRVRMIVASFLIKDLLVPWAEGEAWFWDTLVDADLANNSASWQWVAGSGADAAPYFRIFNPVTQGKTFDPEGVYVRRWVPEIAALGDDAIHAPWEAPAGILKAAGVQLGTTYPLPIVDHGEARRAALAALERVKACR
ncbi:deoxyribodipyrimidine photo-lyase [Hyphomicrobium sp.]|uniref:cryptochrome/photolyase family protein n=1 Tax=Hyphomicrobium sp. TaxID=82 RepID=UPI0025BDA399|nr:deoxyribodipyrimidine photo-lyase [Hyphomicrobium sp.]